jgi:hypothetical protein
MRGLVSPGPAEPGGVDLARSFNGSSDFITLPYGVTNALANGSAISMACWFMGSAAQSDIRLQPNTGNYVVLNWNNNSAGAGSCIMSNDGGAGSGLNWTSTVVDGNWHHLAMSWGQSATFAIYLDGSLVTSRAASSNLLPPFTVQTFQPALGAYLGGPNEFTTGNLADVAVWSIALNSTQISNLASGQRANTIGSNANLIDYLPILGQSPEPDKSGNSNNGVLTGTSVVAGPPNLQLF